MSMRPVVVREVAGQEAVEVSFVGPGRGHDLESGRTKPTLLLVLASIWPLAGCATEGPRPDPTESFRPRIGQVVDANSGKPLDGAVVLDVFYLWPRRASVISPFRRYSATLGRPSLK